MVQLNEYFYFYVQSSTLKLVHPFNRVFHIVLVPGLQGHIGLVRIALRPFNPEKLREGQLRTLVYNP